jgi:tetratricopeptide (TPR) repeat protein
MGGSILDRLDLNAHDPEEYEGKLVVHNGCEYLVGAHLGAGAERIVHKLINRTSGLCLHVLKIWRHGSLGYVPSEVRAKLAAGRTPEVDFAKIIPVSIEIELPGGRAEMQIYVGDSRDERSQADLLIDRADESLDKSQFREATTLYERTLAENPEHTRALVNLAAARAGEKELEGAYQAAAKAARIEPNYPLYRRAVIHYLAAQGLRRPALDEFRSSQRDFPNVHDFDDLGAELLLVCGEPESAMACAQECLLDLADKDRLIAKVRAAVEASSKARILLSEARSLVKRREDPLLVVDVLERARAIDQNNPLLTANLALTLARVGRCHEAIPLLRYAATHGPSRWAKVCYANAAFCAMQDGELRGAMILLNLAMSYISAELGGRELENLAADLPGKGIWVEEECIIEEKLDSAARLVLRSVEAYEKESTMPAEAAGLARLYARVLEPRRVSSTFRQVLAKFSEFFHLR